MNTQNQQVILNRDWLYQHGYTVRQAARAINRSKTHVAFVLSGKRTSCTTIQLLRSLPKRPLILRERLTVK